MGPSRKTAYRPTIQKEPYDYFVRYKHAFVAAVELPDVGGHAVFVRQAFPDTVELIDPRNGSPQTMLRGEFERIWDGTALMIIHKLKFSPVDTPGRKIRE